MLLELAARLQPVAAPCRDFDPMYDEADAAGRALRVDDGHVHIGRLELASFSEPPGVASGEVAAAPDAECFSQSLTELEPVRFDVQGSPSVLRTTTADLRNGRTNSSVADLPTPPDFTAAATRVHHQAKREARKEVASPSHEACRSGAKRYDEKAGNHLGQPTSGCLLLPAVYGYVLLNSNTCTL